MRVAVDFNEVKPGHEAVDARLFNWARWCHARPAPHQGPIWRLGKPAQEWHPTPTGYGPVNKLQAAETEKYVCALPEKHREAIRWCYVDGWAPHKRARTLGVTIVGLSELIHDGRTMLINRLTRDRRPV